MLDLLNDLLLTQLPLITLIGLGALFWLPVAALVLRLRRRAADPAPRAAYQPPANALQHR
ncbi:hypothetical protein SBP02_00305 [Pseudomonas benzenivorans]|uniref:Uncharacterized protein n=1 Tax=Pseudomonas benzenivorans TaxID=556533 RepID=A0ABZ0PWD8_9PSED|nr:hypothetical protein [Pseudomonas benzenivorans]WPC05226.1 hypothetical protein SBP02_00305 [Pseudomonas benzenivorans]